MIVVLMGVTGSGKTTIGRLLAEQLGWKFLDADDFHPAANVAKMRTGIPLDDADRWPWLDAINRAVRDTVSQASGVVLGCSALKRAYRERLASGLTDLRWVHLKGDFDVIRPRLEQRKGHYMNPSLLRSQFEALEEPEHALTLDIRETPERLAQRIAAAIGPG
jgi:gluconokinase